MSVFKTAPGFACFCQYIRWRFASKTGIDDHGYSEILAVKRSY